MSASHQSRSALNRGRAHGILTRPDRKPLCARRHPNQPQDRRGHQDSHLIRRSRPRLAASGFSPPRAQTPAPPERHWCAGGFTSLPRSASGAIEICAPAHMHMHAPLCGTQATSQQRCLPRPGRRILTPSMALRSRCTSSSEGSAFRAPRRPCAHHSLPELCMDPRLAIELGLRAITHGASPHCKPGDARWADPHL